MRLPGLSEFLDLAASRYSVPCTLFGVLTPLRFSPRGLPRLKLMVRGILSQTWTPLQRPVEIPTVRLLSRAASRPSSLEVLRPYSAPKNIESALSPLRASSASTPCAIPSQPFSGSQGFDLQRSTRPCFMPLTLMGLLPFKVFPFRKVLPDSSPGVSLTMFLRDPLRQ
jgi:hypothetical protein